MRKLTAASILAAGCLVSPLAYADTTVHFTVTADFEKVWPAALLAVSDTHMSIKAIDKASGLISAEEGVSGLTVLMSQKGEDVEIEATSKRIDLSKIVIGGPKHAKEFKKSLLKRLGLTEKQK